MKEFFKHDHLFNNEVVIVIELENEEPCEECHLKLFINKNGALGLGKSLIRYAHDKRKCGHHWHFDPLVKGEPKVQTLGVFLSPDSCKMFIGSNDTNTKDSSIKSEHVKIDDNLVYKFNLKESFEVLEDFKKDRNNVLQVNIFNKNNKNITQQCHIVGIWLTTNAMINFGTELIRLAYKFEEGKTITIEPSTETEVKQTMGIFLTPDSCPLTIECKSFGTIDQCVEEYANKKS